jgi:hypothetical protein
MGILKCFCLSLVLAARAVVHAEGLDVEIRSQCVCIKRIAGLHLQCILPQFQSCCTLRKHRPGCNIWRLFRISISHIHIIAVEFTHCPM